MRLFTELTMENIIQDDFRSELVALFFDKLVSVQVRMDAHESIL